MAKKILMGLLAFLLTGLSAAWAAEPVKVAIFPFDIFSREPLEYLRVEMQDRLKSSLAVEGLTVVPPGEVNRELKAAGKPLDLSLARQLAGRLGAEYAVYGSLTKIGARISLDVKVLDALGMKRPESVFVEGAGLDSIPMLSNQLAREVASKVAGREKVAQVLFAGNRRIEAEAIRAVLGTKPGALFSPLRLDEDLRAVWKMGYFDDVRVETKDSPQGKVITFVVKEKPTVREVKITGNKAITNKDLTEQIGLKPFSVYQPTAIKDAERKIVKLYHDKGFYDVKVKSEVIDLPAGDKGIKIDIEEGKKIFIKTIRFSGNKTFNEKQLRAQMSTREEGWLSWITDDNILDRSKLEQDREKLNDFYYNEGYLHVRISEPLIKREEGGLLVTFNIDEGPRFKVSSLSLSGDMILPQAEMMKGLKTKAGSWFSRQSLREDLMYLNDLYANRGHAYVEVRPDVKENAQNKTVAINFNIKQGQKVYFERVIITGNVNTRDNVIRRELGAVEDNLFSSKALRDGNMRLQRLNYFEDVHITTNKGSAADRMDIKINVKEKRTGQFSVGAGYSSADGPMIMGSISEANLFGRGQTLELRGQLGGKSTRYTLSFTEPWLFDQPISAGFDIYDWKQEYTDYDKESIGVRFRFGFPTPYSFTRLYTYYRIEQAEVSGVSDTASRIIRDQIGTHMTSAVKGLLRRDTRNHVFNPTEGSDNSVSLEYAGGPIGGTNDFIKAIGDTGWYFPAWFGHTFVLHGRVGWLTGHSSGTIPIYEKFFLGGINTLRGFDYYSVGPKDPATGDVIGGERMAMANFEYRFPLYSKAGIVGVIFYDTGNSWTEEDGYKFGDLRKSAGGGIRWYSPMGPLRLEYGHVLDPKDGEKSGNWEFTIGSMF